MKRPSLGLIGWMSGLGVCVATIVAGCGSTDGAVDEHGKKKGSSGSNSTGFDNGGGNGPGGCEGLQCQQKSCGGGAETTVTGKVYAPNGTLPLYNAIVYVPNAAPSALTKGASCDKCGAVTGQPIVTALTDATGTFTLRNVPVGKDIPLVIQIGKWRRQVKLPEVQECTENTLTDPELTRLPRKQSEGDIPRIALTAGAADNVGCMLPKIGIDPSEFGVENDGASKAVNTYATDEQAPTGATSAEPFWRDSAKLKAYDMVILSCEGDENPKNKGTPAYSAVTDYLEAGGRVFTTHFMYTWYKNSPEKGISSMAQIASGKSSAPAPTTIDTSFPKGKALSDWLASAAGISGGKVAFGSRGDFVSVDKNKATVWGTAMAPSIPIFAPGGGPVPSVITANVPVGAPADQQCGRAVHIDEHVNDKDKIDHTYPASCSSKLFQAESLLAFFFFDLASCIQNDAEPPKPPGVK